jgi:hypothetical protein
VRLELLGREFAGILRCDYFSAYRKYMKDCDLRVQFCLAHFIREINFLTTLPDAATAAYGERCLEGLRALFHVIHRHDAMEAGAFAAALTEAREAILHEAQRDVPTNNLAELAICFVAIDRRITQGTRGER